MASSAKFFDNSWHSSNPAESTTLVVRIVLSWSAVLIRIGGKLLRQHSLKALYWDDLLILIACIIGTAGPATQLWGLTKGGNARLSETVTLSALLIKEGKYKNVQSYLKALWISGTTLYATLCFIRLSVLVFYRTIFGVNSRFRKAAYAMGVVNILWALGAILGNTLNCKPVGHYWDPRGPGKCGNALRFLLIVTILDIILDTAIIILPIPQILKLNTTKRARVAIAGIFCVGIFVVVTNIIRLYYLQQPGGRTINQRRAVLWTSIHVTAAFICACLPLFKPLVSKIATATQQISAYALSLLGSAGSGSHHSLRSVGRRQQPKNGSSEPDGDFVRMVDHPSENSFQPGIGQYGAPKSGEFVSSALSSAPSKPIIVEKREEV